MAEPLDSGRTPGNRNLDWKNSEGRKSNRRCLCKAKPESTNTGSKRQIATNGESRILSPHRIETKPQQQYKKWRRNWGNKK